MISPKDTPEQLYRPDIDEPQGSRNFIYDRISRISRLLSKFASKVPEFFSSLVAFVFLGFFIKKKL